MIGSFGAEENYYHGFNNPENRKKLHFAKLRKLIAPLRYSLAARVVIKETGINKNSKVLEIGCGVGLLGEAINSLLKTRSEYYGLDLNYDPSLVVSKLKGLYPIRADAAKMPFPDDSFDCVISMDVFEHIKDANKLVEETFRVVKPGGVAFIVICDPSEGRFHVPGHIDRLKNQSDIPYWTALFKQSGFNVLPNAKKYQRRDWRKIFNLPLLRRIKDKAFFSCCFDLVSRPGVYILQKPDQIQT